MFLYKKGTLTLPGITLPIKNISSCSPDIWHAIVCALQIKPCTRLTHSNQICYEDCYDILTNCIDWTKLKTTRTAETICSRFASKIQPCVSLIDFSQPAIVSLDDTFVQFKSPCQDNLCNQSSELCVMRKDRPNGYACVPSCSLGFKLIIFLMKFGIIN